MTSLLVSAPRLAVYRPEIPQNVGSLLRLSACLGVFIYFIGPFPFLWSDRHLKRAGLDYIPDAHYQKDFSFVDHAKTLPEKVRKIGLIPGAKVSFHEFSYEVTDVLYVGSEHNGFDAQVQDSFDACVSIPMCPKARSLNLVVAASLVVSEAFRQLSLFPPVK
jgi:tRNA (cytidine/uridine-2'-O-)-methyltransferase